MLGLGNNDKVARFIMEEYSRCAPVLSQNTIVETYIKNFLNCVDNCSNPTASLEENKVEYNFNFKNQPILNDFNQGNSVIAKRKLLFLPSDKLAFYKEMKFFLEFTMFKMKDRERSLRKNYYLDQRFFTDADGNVYLRQLVSYICTRLFHGFIEAEDIRLTDILFNLNNPENLGVSNVDFSYRHVEKDKTVIETLMKTFAEQLKKRGFKSLNISFYHKGYKRPIQNTQYIIIRKSESPKLVNSFSEEDIVDDIQKGFFSKAQEIYSYLSMLLDCNIDVNNSRHTRAYRIERSKLSSKEEQ